MRLEVNTMDENEYQYILSVIIPVYNVEKYLKECINSVLRQSIKQIEIILVDDGSKDESGKICDEYSKKERHIRVIHKRNEGLGLTRNVGIELATGKYIAFLDSDDCVQENYYEILVNVAETEKADICFGLGCIVFNRKLEQVLRSEYLDGIKFNSKEECHEQIPRIIANSSKSKDRLMESACMGIYKNEFLKKNNIRFVSEREYVSEDLWFNLDCFNVAKKVCYTDTVGYRYRYNENSLVRGYRADRFRQITDYVHKLGNKCYEMGFCDCRERIYIWFWPNFEKCINQEIRFNKKNSYENIKKMIKDKTAINVMNYLIKTPYLSGMHRLLCILMMKKKYRLVISLLKIYNKIVHGG